MRVDIFSCSLFRLTFGENMVSPLIGSQCAYPDKIQEYLINIFVTDKTKQVDELFQPFCFKANDVYLYPKITYSTNEIDIPIIIVSDDFFEEYFKENSTNINFDVIFNLPHIDTLQLTSNSYEIKDFDIITFLLTEYFNACSVINIQQKFTVSNHFDNPENGREIDMTFTISKIIYKNDIKSNLEMRYDELEKTFLLNDKLNSIYKSDLPPVESKTNVINYAFYYNKVLNKKPTFGYLVNNDVQIDFNLAEKPEQPPIVHEIVLPVSQQVDNVLTPVPNKQIETFTPDEVRQKRLEYFKNK